MKDKLSDINLIKEQIKEIKKKIKTENCKKEKKVKVLFKEMMKIKKSLMTSERFIGKNSISDDRKFGRKTCKTMFEESMELPYDRFILYQKYFPYCVIQSVFWGQNFTKTGNFIFPGVKTTGILKACLSIEKLNDDCSDSYLNINTNSSRLRSPRSSRRNSGERRRSRSRKRRRSSASSKGINSVNKERRNSSLKSQVSIFRKK